MREQMDEALRMQKAMTTGSNIVLGGATGGQALREQFLFDDLPMYGPMQDDCALIKHCPMKDSESTLMEWSLEGTPSPGDGFVSETGSDGLFGVDFFDDVLERLNEPISFMAEGRQIGSVTTAVKNLMDPRKAAKRGMLASLFLKANMAGYWGDKSKSQTQFNGFHTQIRSWCDDHPDNYGCLYDAGGKPLDRIMIQDICNQNGNRWGQIDMLIQSLIGKSDTSQLLWPERREQEGKTGGSFGGQYNTFDGPLGPVKLIGDKVLRANQPLVASGPGSDGLPRTTANVVAGSIPWAGNPFAGNGSVAAVSAGTGNFWDNFTVNTASTALATAPAVPNGYLSNDGGNNYNRLAGGTYYFAVSVVYKGFESAAYVWGAGTQASNVIVGTPSSQLITFGQEILLTFDLTQITGLTTSYARSLVKLRVYRYGGPGTTGAPTMLNQFQFLQETGIPTGGNTTVLYDNGYSMPGTDTALGITSTKGGVPGWAWMNLLPLMQKDLPILPMAEQFCLLWFTSPLLRVRPHNTAIRNIGRAS
jgi:hypothetical protein